MMDPPEDLPPFRLGLSMVLISFATVLFTLAIWKLLSFFIMPSLFFDLLFVGFPLGAFIGVRFFGTSLASFRKTLWILQGAIASSIALSLACKHFDYLRAHLFEVKLVRLLGQMGTFTLLFIPFFCAYGLSEYIGYQVGRGRLRGRMRLVYALYLFGAAGAYLFLELARRQLGVTGMLGLSLLLVAAASLVLSGKRIGAWVAGAECAVLLILAAFPGLAAIEDRFLDIYKGAGSQSTKDYITKGYDVAFRAWGRYSLTEVLYSPRARQFAGFYNDLMQWEYAPGAGFTERMLGAVPIHFAPAGGKIAVIGAGGGRQVKWALQPRYRFEKILALEIEPAVFEAVRGPLREAFGGVYEPPNVVPIVSEARSYMEAEKETYDLIFLPSVGGYPQMMLEPGNMIRTADAYRTLVGRLGDRGVLAIWYPKGLDHRAILTKEYVRTLGEQGLGMKTVAYENDDEYLILAARNPSTPLPSPEEIDLFLTAPTDPSGLPPVSGAGARTRTLFVFPERTFQPITDERPFLAGNVRHIFSLEDVFVLFACVGSLLLLIGTGAFFFLRRSGDPRIPGRPYWQVAALAFLIGANFILIEHFAILAIFKKLYVFQDALFLGAISFLVLSGLGSALVAPRTRSWIQGGALLLFIPLLAFQGELPAWAVIALLAPVAFATGSFFPGLFELAARNPLAVFAMDALGAAFGSMAAFFVPIAFGFSAFFPIAAFVFAGTSVATWTFLAGRAPREVPESTRVSGEAH